MAQVPDQALAYLKPGDDYAIGGLLVHVNRVLVHYRRVLVALVDGGYAPVEALDSPSDWSEAAVRAKAGLDAAERDEELRLMRAEHAAVVAAARSISDDDWVRKTAVTYEVGAEPFPSSPDDILMWLRDHYREHVDQCPELVAEWARAAG